MIQMQMSNDDLLDVLELMASSLNCSIQFVTRLVFDSREDVGDLRSPHSRVVFATACLPEYTPLDRMVNEDAVHGKLASLVDKRDTFGRSERGIATADDKRLIAFQPSDFQHLNHIIVVRHDIQLIS